MDELDSTYCHVLPGRVTRLRGLEGDVVRVICPMYKEPDGRCGVKERISESGPLGQLLERVETETIGSTGVYCHLK